MNARAFHASIRGASHIRKQKECQDYAGSYTDGCCTIAAVCDGHGGNDYVRSALGAQYACQSAMQNIQEFVHQTDAASLRHESDRLLRELESSIITTWNALIRLHYDTHPFSTEELAQVSAKARQKYQDGRIESAYGTTLIAAAVTADYWFAVQIGDGKCVAVTQEGQFGQPIPPNDRCFLHATTSICDADALDNFRHRFSEKLPVAVFVGSDGVDDCFKNKEQLYNLYKTVLYSFTQSAFDAAVDEFKDYLPRLSEKGSGDDVSVAAVLDLEKIGQLEAIRDYDAAREKARVEQHVRMEEARLEEERLRVQARYEEQERARHAREEARKRREAEQARQTAAQKQRESERRQPRAECGTQSSAEQAPPYRQNYCEACGRPLKPGACFCGYCGCRIGASFLSPGEAETQELPAIPSELVQQTQGELAGLLTELDQAFPGSSYAALTPPVGSSAMDSGEAASEEEAAACETMPEDDGAFLPEPPAAPQEKDEAEGR